MTDSEKIIKRHHELSRKCFDEALKVAGRRVVVTPGFEARDPDPRKDYGIRGCHITFFERRFDRAVDITFLTDWYPVEVQERLRTSPDVLPKPLCQGTYFHSARQDDMDITAYHSTECHILGGECYGEAGSALGGERITERLLNEGSAAIWDEIDKAFGMFSS